jgi:hypothetical protein
LIMADNPTVLRLWPQQKAHMLNRLASLRRAIRLGSVTGYNVITTEGVPGQEMRVSWYDAADPPRKRRAKAS